MREAVEKFSISALEKWMTEEKVCRRRSRPMAADTREAMRPTRMATTTISSVRPSICPPTRNRYCIWTSCATPCASYSRLTSRVAWLAMLERVVSSICAIALASCCWIISREKPGICAMAANWAHTASRSAAVGAMVSAAVSSVFSEEAALSAAPLEAAGYSERGAMPCAGIPVPLAACEAAIYSTMSGMVTISSREARSSAVRSSRSFRTPSS